MSDDPHFNGPLTQWMRQVFAPIPDPWSAEIDHRVRNAGAVPLCTNCLFPLEPEPQRWFCPHCDSLIGDYVALNPYLQVLLMGEFLRRGVTGPPEHRRSVQAFLVFYSLTQYMLFAPIYWYWMTGKAEGKPICRENRKELSFEEIPPPRA